MRRTPRQGPAPGNAAADLNVLSPRLRRTCALAWLDRLSHTEIAAAQGISVGAVAMRVYRARVLLAAAGVGVPDGRRRPGAAKPRQLSCFENA